MNIDNNIKKGNEEYKLKKTIIHCKVLEKQYPNGMPEYANYFHLDFFEDEFYDDWYHNDDGIPDQYQDFELYYFDNEGRKFNVEVELSEEDKKEIEKYPVKE